MSIKKTISLSIKTLIAASFCLCPIKKNKIVMESFGGKNFSDNPKVIALEIVKQKKPWDVVWLSQEKPTDLPEEIRWVKYGTIKALYEWGTARVWIDNVRHQFRPIKRKRQYYIQTWHGAFSLKCIEKDAEDKLDKEYVKSAKKDGRITNAIISNSKLLDEVFERAFWLNQNAKILRIGCPRNDTLFQHMKDKGIAKKVKKKLGIPEDTYTILYAPTFRDDHSTDGYIKGFDQIITSFERKLNKKCCVLIRMHPNVSKQALGFDFSSNIINASDFPDVQELALATDCVISDYSTIVFDYLLLKKPAFLCALDIDHYNELRGVLPIIYDLPCGLAQSIEDLNKNIDSFNMEEYLNRVDDFFCEYPVYDKGDAAAQVVDHLQQNCFNMY